MMRRILAHIQPTTRKPDIDSTIYFVIMLHQQFGQLDIIQGCKLQRFYNVPCRESNEVKVQDKRECPDV
jgi:hypothetical protein